MYVRENVLSAVQDYPENAYRIIYIDDRSTDQTYPRLILTVEKIGKPYLFSIYRNPTNRGALCNHWNAIHQLVEDDEIVVILDGDDQLAGPFVLAYLNEIYQDETVWLTYGQYQEKNSGDIGFNKPMPDHTVKGNAFRKWKHIPSHLRTFYAKLYKNIKLEHLTRNNVFFPMNADMATMLPMIEMARDHFRFIPEVLYLYNDTNSLSDHRKSRNLQLNLDKHIRRLPVYAPLDVLF